MNNYLDKVFDTPNKKAFIAFLTAGDPDADSTVKFILEMEKAGATTYSVQMNGGKGRICHRNAPLPESHHLKTDSALSRSKSVRKEDDLFTGTPLPAGNTMPRSSTHPERNTQAAVFCTAAWTSV